MVLENPGIEVKTGRSGLVQGRPLLVLIHGSGGRAGSWGAQINPLDRHMNVMALSLPGHGETRGPLLESMHEYGRWLENTLEALRAPGPLFLCGMSLGGAVVLESVRLNPKRYHGVILIGSGARLDDSVEIIGKLGQNWPEGAWHFIDLIFSEHADVRTKEISHGALLAAGPDVLSADLSVSRHFDFDRRLEDITVPCLIIGGRQDRIVTPEKCIDLAARLPNARTVILEKAGHMVMLEQYRKVNEAILEFVMDIGAPQT